MSVAIEGRGTTENEWAQWLDSQPWPLLDTSCPGSGRVCVVAAHPDDEILGAAGLLCRLARHGCGITAVWATDGEASHPETTVLSRSALGQIRRAESCAALVRLGIRPATTHYLGLPDGGLSTSVKELRDDLARIVDPDDLLIVPWEGDGHPDHEAVGHACADLGLVRWQYPIWMWHWASPADNRVPWARLHTSEVDDIALKADAIREFSSQVHPLGPHDEDAAVLPPHVVSRFLRSREWFFA